jgi:hypothetical protein
MSNVLSTVDTTTLKLLTYYLLNPIHISTPLPFPYIIFFGKQAAEQH